VLPRATDPKSIDAGAREILAAPGVFCWLDATFDAPVNPMQPALESAAKSKMVSVTSEILLLPTGFACGAHFPARQNNLFLVMFVIEAIVDCGQDLYYCPYGHLWDRGTNLHLRNRCGGNRRAASRFLCVARLMDLAQRRRNLWDSGANFRRVGALDAAGINGCNYIVICLAGGNGRIHVCG
jgi:hypothetical protein